MDDDELVRRSAFQFLESQCERHGEVLRWQVLAEGFSFRGRRVPLLGPQGIFKPSILDLPLSITTSPPDVRRPPPYKDFHSPGGFLSYCYRGRDPEHRDNRGLRACMTKGRPLAYL